MIEFPITLTSGGSVCLPGHAFALALGYTKNQGVYRLHIDATGEWEGLTIRAFWHVPDGKDPVSSLVADGYVAVPASVTAQPGNGCVTFEGSDGTRTVTSADLRYRVAANSGTDDGSMPEPGTPAWQELVGAVHTDATAAEQAKTDAQTAATESAASAEKAAASKKAAEDAKAKAAESLQELKNGIASGNFKGDPGVSPTVTVQDITGGHRIVITDETGTSSVDVLNGKQGDPGKPGDTGATPELTIGTVKEGDAPSATITGTVKKPILNLTLKSGAPGKDATVDATLTQSGQAADAKVTGDAISAVKARQNILIGSETGNPIAVDDAFSAPLCGLTVYGRSTRDGTPSPDAPIPIVSAGDGGSITVTLSDGNGKTQTLTLPTPNGLPGIPVRSGGSYTDQSGQQWVCDEVDLERGVKVQRVKTKELSPDDKWTYYKLASGNNNFQTRIYGEDASKNSFPSICNILPFKNVIWNDGIQNLPKIYANNQEITVSFPPNSEYSSLEAFKQLLTNVKSIIYYCLASPIETPLTPAEIAAYKALTAYGPDTVVQAGDGAGVKLGYQRDVNIAIKRIEDAIASMTTT